MDVLSTLQECSFRGIQFPVTSIVETFSHDLPQHKAVDRDGAFIENTGRNPITFVLTIPFIAKTLARGQNEKWDNLYPTLFEVFRIACLLRETGEFQHPLYGKFKVKVSDWKSSLNADERGGQTAEVTLIETRDDGETQSFTPSDKARAQSAAISLDAKLGALNPPPPGAQPEPDTTWEDVVDEILFQINSKTLWAKQALTKIDKYVAKLDRLSNSIDRAAEVITVDAASGISRKLGILGPGAGPIWTDCQVLRSSLMDVRSKLAANGNKTLSTYIIPRPTMLISLATTLKSTPAEILALNPGLPRSRPSIPSNTVVQYYAR